MEGTLYIILDSRSLFIQKFIINGSEKHENLLVSGSSVWNTIFQFSRLFNLKNGQKKKVNIYICDSSSDYLIFDGFISNITKDLQDKVLFKKLIEFGNNLNLGEMNMSATISKCLCKINSIRRSGYNRSERDRIILIDASESNDYINQYVSLLNCGFASKKLNVVIDVISISKNPSPLFNNLADVCNGLYLKYSQIAESIKEENYEDQKVNLDDGLISFFIFHLLPSVEAREEIFIKANGTKQTGLAVCFCHHKKLEIGYVCSSCLSIFCSLFKAPICSTCGARLKRVPIQQKILSNLNIEDGKNIY